MARAINFWGASLVRAVSSSAASRNEGNLIFSIFIGHATLSTVTTVMSSFCPHVLTAFAIWFADLPLIARVRSKLNYSPFESVASITPSERKMSRCCPSPAGDSA